MPRSDRLILAHLWVAFGSFALAALFGAWQMLARSPFPVPLESQETYFAAVTAHGTIMGYVVPTLFAMGFGYFVAETALRQPLPYRSWAWAGFWLGIVGLVMAAIPILAGRASVLYTFYPPLVAHSSYYLGILLVVVGSWIWCWIMIEAMRRWKRANPGAAVPLAMFATVANAIMWLWTTVGVGAELIFQILPVTFGWKSTIDVGLARTLFSWTLHAIVYFWLIPAYIAFYTMLPRAAGGYLYSDNMGRLAFILFLVFSLPVGMHHLLMDPEHGVGFKFLQVAFTAMVAMPTLLTIFTIGASLEIAGRLHGGRGLFGWIRALPWERPMVLASGLAFVMLGFGGFGGLINMSYGMNAMVHNTSWVTAHFHLIFGGSTVIMYFAIAYELWPKLTGRALPSLGRVRAQLWLWFLGIMVTTLPWHVLGLMGQPRRVANFNYADPIIAAWGPWVVVSAVGGAMMLISALLLVFNLAQVHSSQAGAARAMSYAVPVHPPGHLPPLLNGFALWNGVVAAMMLVAYGFPIAQFFLMDVPAALAQRLGWGP